MTQEKGLLTSGSGIVSHNKRYILWFYLLNLALAWFGTSAFREHAHLILDHSLLADRLVHGLSLPVVLELLSRPEMGPRGASATPALWFSFLFLLATALFLPGVFQGYASSYRLSREDFLRACGRNLWRFIRLMVFAGIVMLIATVALFGIKDALAKQAGESTNEMLPFEVQMAGLFVIFLVMSTLRIWFDLAEADVVLNDQRVVLRSIAAAFRHTFHSLGRLLGSYALTTIVAAIVLGSGFWMWMKLVAPERVLGAFLISQFTLLLLLIPRFWQRGIAVSYWQQNMMVPVVPMQPIQPEPVLAAVGSDPVPVVPGALPAREQSWSRVQQAHNTTIEMPGLRPPRSGSLFNSFRACSRRQVS